MLKFLYRMLENPGVYNLSQKLLAGDRVFRAIRKVIAKQLSSISYNNVLDVGCGTGLFADCFKGKYTGIDINQEYIKMAETKGNGTFLVADATSLPFNDKTFDLVFTMGVLHHINKQEREKMLNEMWRVCKADGHILIVDGLVPSNRLNLIGYVLAKLDRGRFKMRMERFKEMINSVYLHKKLVKYILIKIFPYEIVTVNLQK
jgi:ubiquinone/menaquinone biosynthesis C-methylase UbiE